MTYEQFTNRYTFNTQQHQIGKGGFGSVYKAYDNITDTWVAIKVAEVLSNHQSFRLKYEYQKASTLSLHENIAQYTNCYSFIHPNAEYDYAIMQYYEFGNMQQLLAKNTLNDNQKIQLLKGILNGIAILHKHNIIHRDLKPENILIAKKPDGSFVPKITDFGISKIMGTSNTVTVNTVQGGTFTYSSPEQLAGREIRKNADLWSYGVMVCKVFKGYTPFDSGNNKSLSEADRAAAINNILNATVPPDFYNIPTPFNKLIEVCLQKDPTQRVKDAIELQGYLQNPNLPIVPFLQSDKGNFIKENEVRYSDEDLVIFKINIDKILKEAQNDLEYLQGIITSKQDKNENESNIRYMTMKDGSQSIEREQLVQMENRQIVFIEALEKALLRIDNKTYGVCRITGKLIEKSRLISVPHATLSEEAKQKVDVEHKLILQNHQKLFLKREYDTYGNYGNYGYVDNYNRLVIPYKYIEAKNFINGLALVGMYNNSLFSSRILYGFINENGEEVIPFKYEAALEFSEGFAGITIKNKKGFIDIYDNLQIPALYDSINSFKDGLAIVNANYKWGFINKKNEVVIPLMYDRAQEFTEGYCLANNNGKHGVINSKNDVIIPFIYSRINKMDGDIFLVRTDGKSGYINSKNQILVPIIYDDLGRYDSKEILIAAWKNMLCGFIDITGKVVIDFKYSYATDFTNGTAIVSEKMNIFKIKHITLNIKDHVRQL